MTHRPEDAISDRELRVALYETRERLDQAEREGNYKRVALFTASIRSIEAEMNHRWGTKA